MSTPSEQQILYTQSGAFFDALRIRLQEAEAALASAGVTTDKYTLPVGEGDQQVACSLTVGPAETRVSVRTADTTEILNLLLPTRWLTEQTDNEE